MQKTDPSALSRHVRHLLHEADYTGPRCHTEFGVSLSWYSEFMRGQHSPRPILLEKIYKHLTGQPLFPEGTQLMQPVCGLKKGAWRTAKDLNT